MIVGHLYPFGACILNKYICSSSPKNIYCNALPASPLLIRIEDWITANNLFQLSFLLATVMLPSTVIKSEIWKWYKLIMLAPCNMMLSTWNIIKLLMPHIAIFNVIWPQSLKQWSSISIKLSQFSVSEINCVWLQIL